MSNKTPPNIIKILSTTSENKIKALRKAKGFSPSRLAKQAKIDKEQLLVLESSRVELITSELSKIAKALQVDDDLLLDGAAVLPSADLRQLNYIFMQQKQKADISLLQTQILNWAVVLLHNVRKEWENMRASSFAVIAQMDRKQNQTSLTPQQNQMQNSFAFGNNNQNQMMTNNNSQAKQTPSNNLSGNNSGLNNNFNNSTNNNPYAKLKQWLGQSEQNINSALYPKAQGDDANSYQLAQNNKTNTMTDANNNQNKPAVTFNDIYWGNGDRQNTHQIEGGYNNNRANDRGGPTNFAVTQGTLNEYNNWNSSLRTGFNFPKDVRNLTPEQARQILDERFYQAYNIKALQNPMIASNVFDAEINQGTQAGRWLADSVNEHFETTYPQNKVISSKLAEKINNLSKEDAITINDIYTKKRMQSYWDLVDKDHSQINNIKSWYNRARNHYSNPQEFDRLYQSILDEYLNRKYPQYYNGK